MYVLFSKVGGHHKMFLCKLELLLIKSSTRLHFKLHEKKACRSARSSSKFTRAPQLLLRMPARPAVAALPLLLLWPPKKLLFRVRPSFPPPAWVILALGCKTQVCKSSLVEHQEPAEAILCVLLERQKRLKALNLHALQGRQHGLHCKF